MLLSVSSSLIIGSVEQNNELKEYADIIQTNSNLLLQLISDVLDISRLESGKLQFNYEWCELVNHCQNMITLTRPEQDKGCRHQTPDAERALHALHRSLAPAAGHYQSC